MAAASLSEIDGYIGGGGRVKLMRGEAAYIVKAQRPPHCVFTETTACDSHAKKFWVCAVAPGVAQSEEELRALAQRHGFESQPFLVGKVGSVGENIVIWRCSEKDRHRAKGLSLEGVQCLTLKKGGGQSKKLITTVEQAIGTCSHLLTNMQVVHPDTEQGSQEAVGLQYEEALATVIGWGTERLVAFVENAKLKLKRKQPVTEMEETCMSGRAPMLEAVKLREDADDWVYHLDTPKQQAACPMPLGEAATTFAHNLKCYRWEPTQKGFIKETLREWLDGPAHLLTTLIIIGEGGKGKSKLLHALAQEVCIGEGKTSYLFGKNLDALGILSYAGEVRRAAAVCLTDCNLKVARGGSLSSESLKSLLDVVEGGSLPDTRYRPAQFPPGLVRMLAYNGNARGYGDFFINNGQAGLGYAIGELALRGEEAAARMLRGMSSDDQASARRASIAICVGEEDLITEETKAALMSATTERAEAAKARRTAHWRAQQEVA